LVVVVAGGFVVVVAGGGATVSVEVGGCGSGSTVSVVSVAGGGSCSCCAGCAGCCVIEVDVRGCGLAVRVLGAGAGVYAGDGRVLEVIGGGTEPGYDCAGGSVPAMDPGCAAVVPAFGVRVKAVVVSAFVLVFAGSDSPGPAIVLVTPLAAPSCTTS
jgi:hypothetical protein